MYTLRGCPQPSSQLQGLGFTLPPWLQRVAGAVLQGTTISIPTPIGRQVFDLSDPQQVAKLKAILAGVKVTGPGSTPPAEPLIPPAVASAAPIALGVAAVVGLMLLLRR